jgi:hypothetical protein
MDRKQALSKIKDTLKSLMAFSNEIKGEVEGKKFGSFDLTDGTKITSPSTDLEVGSEVYAIDDNGNQTPLDDGEYVLTDGRTITVKANMVDAIAGGSTEDPTQEQAEGAEQVAEGQQASVKMEDGLPQEHPAEADGAAHDDIQSRLTDIEKQVEDILNIINKLGTTQEEVNEQMMSKIENLSEINGDKPIRTKKREFTDYKQGKSDFSEELREFLKERKIKNKI